MDGLDEDFEWISSGQEVDDFEGVSDDSDGLDFLTGVSAMELKRSNKSLNNGSKCLSELFSLIPAGSMWHKNLRSCGLDSNIVLEAWVINLEVIVTPSGEEFRSVFESEFFLFDNFSLLCL